MKQEYNKAETIKIIEGSLWILKMQLVNLNAGRIRPRAFTTVAEQRKSWEAIIKRDEKKLAEMNSA
jgi:hypothetical protein